MRRTRIHTDLHTPRCLDSAGRIALCLALSALTGIALWAPTLANAHSYKLGNIAVGHVWAPPSEEGATGAPVYGPILNRGDTTVRLIRVSTPIAEHIRFRTEKDGEVHWPEAIELRPGKPLALAPWREHIWLSGLKKPIQEGDSFDLTLDFGNAGELKVKIIVEKPTGH